MSSSIPTRRCAGVDIETLLYADLIPATHWTCDDHHTDNYKRHQRIKIRKHRRSFLRRLQSRYQAYVVRVDTHYCRTLALGEMVRIHPGTCWPTLLVDFQLGSKPE
jgi:hypothetical protein